MRGAGEGLGVELGDILGARRPRREPTAIGGHLQAADCRAVAGRRRQSSGDRVPGELRGANLLGRQLAENRLLLTSSRGIYPCVGGRPEAIGKGSVMLR